MSTIRAIYTGAARRELKLFANWEPQSPIAIGDYGRLDGDAFERLGSISSLGVAWQTIASQSLSHRKFTSSGQVSITARAAGTAQGAKAGVDITFGAANAVFMDAAGCSYVSVSDKPALGAMLRTIPGFDRKWAVITDLITAQRTLIAISSDKGAAITFEAKAPVQAVDLADASIDVKASAQRSIGYVVDGETGLSPLFGLCRFERSFLSQKDSFNAMSLTLEKPEAQLEAEPIETFVQLR